MFCWPHFKTCCFDLAHQEQYLLRKQQHETPHSGSCLAYSAVRTLPTRRSSLAQTFFLLVPVLSGEVLWNLRNFSRAGEQLNAQTHLPVTGWKDIFSQAVSVKSFGKIEVAVFPRKKAALICCMSKDHSVTAIGQRADTAQHKRGRNPGWGPTSSASHPSLCPPSSQLPSHQRTPMLASAFVQGDPWFRC